VSICGRFIRHQIQRSVELIYYESLHGARRRRRPGEFLKSGARSDEVQRKRLRLTRSLFCSPGKRPREAKPFTRVVTQLGAQETPSGALQEFLPAFGVFAAPCKLRNKSISTDLWIWWRMKRPAYAHPTASSSPSSNRCKPAVLCGMQQVHVEHPLSFLPRQPREAKPLRGQNALGRHPCRYNLKAACHALALATAGPSHENRYAPPIGPTTVRGEIRKVR